MQTQQRVNWARVREARRRLQSIVKGSKKLGLKPSDLANLRSANLICPPTKDWSYWLLLVVIVTTAAFALLYSICSLLPVHPDCYNGTSPETENTLPTPPKMSSPRSEYEKLYEAPIKGLKDDRIATVRESQNQRRDEDSSTSSGDSSWVGPRIRLPKDR